MDSILLFVFSTLLVEIRLIYSFLLFGVPYSHDRFTKMGFAGNTTPLNIIPTVLSTRSNQRNADQLTDLDVFVGHDCAMNSVTHQGHYLVRNGLVEDWNAMERLWHRCIYDEVRIFLFGRLCT